MQLRAEVYLSIKITKQPPNDGWFLYPQLIIVDLNRFCYYLNMKRSSKKELAELTEKIIHLRDVEGMTYVDIGKHIDKSYCTVMRLYKASGRMTKPTKPQPIEYITVSNEQPKTYEDYIKSSDAMTQACWRARIKGTDKL